MAHSQIAPAEDVQDWPTIEQAAGELKASIRTIWRHNERGVLEIRKRPIAGRKPVNVCNPHDLNKLKPPPYVVKSDSAEFISSQEMMLPVSRVGDALERIVTIFQERQDAVTMALPPSQKLWLTLGEARIYSGLGRKDLIELAASGKVQTRMSGNRRVFQRRSLEAFQG